MHNITTTIPVTNRKLPAKLYMRTATLYYLRLELPDKQILYKLGYTTTSIQERVYGFKGSYKCKYGKRICLRPPHNGMGIPPNTNVYVISTLSNRNGAVVYQWEQYLHSKYAAQRYNGPAILANGNTELYTTDILNLDY